jgi:hypothetical protein
MDEKNEGNKMSEQCKQVNINGANYIREDLAQPGPYKNDQSFPYAIVRCYRAGVLCGYAEYLGGELVKIHRARQMYRWDSSFVLVDLAVKGVRNSENCKFSVESPNPVIVTDACAILECTATAAQSLITIEAQNHG